MKCVKNFNVQDIVNFLFIQISFSEILKILYKFLFPELLTSQNRWNIYQMNLKMQKHLYCCRDLGKILRAVFHLSCCIYLKNWIGRGTGSRVLVQPVSDRPVVIACCGLVRQVRCWFLHSSFIHSFTHSFLFHTWLYCVSRGRSTPTSLSFHFIQF